MILQADIAAGNKRCTEITDISLFCFGIFPNPERDVSGNRKFSFPDDHIFCFFTEPDCFGTFFSSGNQRRHDLCRNSSPFRCSNKFIRTFFKILFQNNIRFRSFPDAGRKCRKFEISLEYNCRTISDLHGKRRRCRSLQSHRKFAFYSFSINDSFVTQSSGSFKLQRIPCCRISVKLTDSGSVFSEFECRIRFGIHETGNRHKRNLSSGS